MKLLVSKASYNIHVIVKTLLILIIISSMYVTSSFFLRTDLPYKEKLPPLPATLKIVKKPIKGERKDYATFLRNIEGKALFASYVQDTSPLPDVNRKELSKKIEQLKLVGIMPKDPPLAMIEHTAMGKTFHLKEGETFLEDIKVEKIEPNSVILNYHGEEVELYL